MGVASRVEKRGTVEQLRLFEALPDFNPCDCLWVFRNSGTSPPCIVLFVPFSCQPFSFTLYPSVFFSPMCTTFDLRETPFRGKPDICMKQDIVLFAISGSRCLDVLDLLLSPVCFKLPFSMRRVTGLRSSKGESSSSSSVRAEQYYS